MKKFVLFSWLVSLLCLLPFAAQAAGLEAGQHTLSVLGGGAYPQGDANIGLVQYTGETFSSKWGDTGEMYGVQYAYSFTPYFALGLEYSKNHFKEGKEALSAYVGNTTSLFSKMDSENFFVNGRFTVNPHQFVRLYIPFGAGVANVWAETTYDFLVVRPGRPGAHLVQKYNDKKTDFAYYVGLGLEMDLVSNFSFGVEGRYQNMRFDSDYGRAMETERLPVQNNNDKNYDYFSVLAKLSYRF